jgi:molybdopterin molybdotransferase
MAMLAAISPLPVESATLDDGLGRVLRRAVQAACDQPPFAVSAMDGYAVRSADTPGLLRLAGESAAGRGFDGVCGMGEAIRISTGAAVPQGTDAVVIQEDVTRDGDEVRVSAVVPGRHIRPRGADFVAGNTLLSPGTALDGAAMALAAASGAAALAVTRRPRVAILSSGNELAAPGTTPGPWQIFDSVTFGVAGLIGEWGGSPQRLAVERDDVAAIAHAAERGLVDSDLLVVIGGASVGDHDHARPALMKLGLTLAVEKVAMRPGKPTWFGMTPHGPVLGLPGNPASALVCAHLFLRPLLAAMLGRAPQPIFHRARLRRALAANGPREHYLRARWSSDDDGCLTVGAFDNQDSSLISVFTTANALIRLPPSAPASEQGAIIDMLMLGRA